MLGLFEDSQIVKEVREAGNGWHFIIEMFKFAIVIYVADAVTNKFALFVINHQIEPFMTLGGEWLVSIGLLSFAAIIYCALWEHMRPRHLGIKFAPPRLVAPLVGYAAGAACMIAALLIATLLGGFALQVNLENVLAINLVWMFFVYLFQAFGEEVMYRGAFMMATVRKNPPIIALIVSALLFSLHHHFNDGYGPIAFVNLFLLGILLGVTVFLTNRIWAATCLHAAWNFFQGNILGVNVSGAAIDPTASVFISTASGNSLVTGGAMGLEGSLVTTIVLVMGLAIVMGVYMTRRKAKSLSS